MHVKLEGETPFESEVECTLPPEAETPTVATMAVAAAAASQQDREEDETLDHVLCQVTANPHASINNNLIRNFNLLCGNIEELDISQLCLLGLEVENEDPLPKILQMWGQSILLLKQLNIGQIQFVAQEFMKISGIQRGVSQQ